MLRLPSVPGRIPVLKSLHRLARALFHQAGYRWELRRNGELKLGLWRKELRKRSAADRKNAPKRFVVVPGFGDTSLSWLGPASVLAPILKRAGYDEVVILDFPGFNGFLAGEKSFHSMDLMIAAVSDVFDELSPDTLFGHSLGGWLSARYAVECGQEKRPLVRKRHGYRGPKTLLLMCPAGVYTREEVRAEFEEVFRRMVGGDGLKAIRHRLFAREPFWFKYVASEFSRFMSDEGIRQFTESVRDEHLVQDELLHVQAATWLIWGEHDTLCPTECLEVWLRGLEKAPGGPGQAVLIRGAGHSPHVEAPAVTLALIGQILLGRKPHVRGARWWKLVGGNPLAAEAV